MKIVKRVEFLAMPPGTVFMSYRPCVFGSLTIKWDTCGNDFLVDSLEGAFTHDSSDEYAEKCDEMASGASLPVDFAFTGRDGCFGTADGQFAVYEPDDVDALIARLQEANRQARTKRP